MQLRDDIIDVMHRYRRGEIKSADDAADEVLVLQKNALERAVSAVNRGQREAMSGFSVASEILAAELKQHS